MTFAESVFLFVISFGLATTGSKAEAQSPPPHQFAHHTLCETLIRLPNPGMDPKVQMDYSTEQWRCISTLSSRIEELQSQLDAATSTIQDQSSLSSTTPACACADGNGLGEGAIPQDVVAPANGDILTKQCQQKHSVYMNKIRRGTPSRVKAKKVNACNHARIGASGIQGTCG